jgi:hypothetical protein
MTKITKSRMTADIEGDFVVFLIGFRINRFWKVWKWAPVFAAMVKMLIELGKNPGLGLLHARTHFGLRNTMVIQYWRSFDELHAYATSKTNKHLPEWQAFNKNVKTNGDVGIWHETYLVKAGAHESVYANMPVYGLAQAGGWDEATGRRSSARGRLGQ